MRQKFKDSAYGYIKPTYYSKKLHYMNVKLLYRLRKADGTIAVSDYIMVRTVTKNKLYAVHKEFIESFEGEL